MPAQQMSPTTQERLPTNGTPSSALANAEKNTRPLLRFYTKFNNDWVMNFAGMLAYNLLMSIFPIALAILAITGLILGSHLDTSIIHAIQQVLPKAVSADVINSIIKKVYSISGIIGIISVILAIFFGSRLFVTIQNCFSIIYHVRPRTAMMQNITAILMLLLFIILIPVMIAASGGPTLVLSILQKTPLQAITHIGTLLYIAGIAGGLLAAFILFEVIYLVMPNQRISFSRSWPGALIAAIALELYLLFFPYYASHFLGGYAGQVGFAIILLVFFYYFAVILLVGAEVNAFFSEHVQPLPYDLATFLTTMTGTLNKDRPVAESASHIDPKSANPAEQTYTVAAMAQISPDTVQTRKSARTLFQRRNKQNAAKEQSVATREAKKSRTLTTVLEVVLGSALALAIELLRQRRHSY